MGDNLNEQVNAMMNLMKFYHYTDNKAIHKKHNIFVNGASLYAKHNQCAGNLGWGFYLEKNISVSERTGGKAIMEVGVDIKSFANIFNPYFLDKTNPHASKTDVDTLYHSIFKRYRVDMSSIDQSSREIQCKTIRDEFLAAGYKGIYTKYDGFETVVFDTAAVRFVSPLNRYVCQGKVEGTQI